MSQFQSCKNNLFLTKLITLEGQCWENSQYSRRECHDIVDIHHEVSGKVLDEKFLKIFGKLGFGISPHYTEVCHCVSRTTNTVIVKFSKRKDCQHVWSFKKDLEKLNTENLELHGNIKLFINRSLCPCYKMLRSKSKKLHTLSKVHGLTQSRSRSLKIARRCQ